LAEEAEFVAQVLNASRARGALDLKARALSGLAAVTALRAPADQLKTHVREALFAGATRDEIVATIVEAALYAGFAAASAGLEAAFAAFRELDAKATPAA
jgi:4-carboxymuconolactone decarboxylase